MSQSTYEIDVVSNVANGLLELIDGCGMREYIIKSTKHPSSSSETATSTSPATTASARATAIHAKWSCRIIAAGDAVSGPCFTEWSRVDMGFLL